MIVNTFCVFVFFLFVSLQEVKIDYTLPGYFLNNPRLKYLGSFLNGKRQRRCGGFAVRGHSITTWTKNGRWWGQ